ncbi:hypothetical protein NKH19_00700 [Mesorhizobium sp. M1338]
MPATVARSPGFTVGPERTVDFTRLRNDPDYPESYVAHISPLSSVTA